MYDRGDRHAVMWSTPTWSRRQGRLGWGRTPHPMYHLSIWQSEEAAVYDATPPRNGTAQPVDVHPDHRTHARSMTAHGA